MADKQTALAPYIGSDAVDLVKREVQVIQQVMRAVMTEGEHYGLIPGCGDKPALLKSGAEKLCRTFRLRSIIDTASDVVMRDIGSGHREYQVTCHILNADGQEVATGLGICSTAEGRYRYRSEFTNKPVPPAYWDSRDPELLGGSQFSPRKVRGEWTIVQRVEHDNPADYWNTCLKMAKKRAMVDGVLSATAASDMFTQDIEEMSGLEREDEDAADAKPAPKRRTTKRTPPAEKKKPADPVATFWQVLPEHVPPVLDVPDWKKKVEAYLVHLGYDEGMDALDKRTICGDAYKAMLALKKNPAALADLLDTAGA